jgi:hypothetical protein
MFKEKQEFATIFMAKRMVEYVLERLEPIQAIEDEVFNEKGKESPGTLVPIIEWFKGMLAEASWYESSIEEIQKLPGVTWQDQDLSDCDKWRLKQAEDLLDEFLNSHKDTPAGRA